MADIFKRSFQMAGIKTFFTTGVDEHGQKNEHEIIRNKVGAEIYLENQSSKFKSLFRSLNISYDYFVRTSSDKHKKTVCTVLQSLWDRGLIKKKEYTGLYCEGCEQFKLETDLDEKGLCPDHLIKPKLEKEENYFFSLEQDREYLIQFIKSNPEWVSPELNRNKVLDMLKKPLRDLCISRPKYRVTLGIEFPFDKDFVTYVWFDALLNYISNIGYSDNSPEFPRLWENSFHLMAKDIIKTHCIYWPIMLKVLGLNPVSKNLIHGFWVGEDGRKISKSLSNGIDPNEVIRKFGSDSLRFFMASKLGKNEVRIGSNLIKSHYTSVLANIFGNAYLRSSKLVLKYLDGKIPKIESISPETSVFLDSLITVLEQSRIIEMSFDAIHNLTAGIEEAGRKINKYIEEKAPWNLAKSADNNNELNSILLVSCEAVRLLFEAAYPVIPSASDKVLYTFNIQPLSEKMETHHFVPFAIKSGIIIKEPEILFPKIE